MPARPRILTRPGQHKAAPRDVVTTRPFDDTRRRSRQNVGYGTAEIALTARQVEAVMRGSTCVIVAAHLPPRHDPVAV